VESIPINGWVTHRTAFYLESGGPLLSLSEFLARHYATSALTKRNEKRAV